METRLSAKLQDVQIVFACNECKARITLNPSSWHQHALRCHCEKSSNVPVNQESEQAIELFRQALRKLIYAETAFDVRVEF